VISQLPIKIKRKEKNTMNGIIREANLIDFDSIEKLEKQVFKIHIDARPDLFEKICFTKEYFEDSLKNGNTKIFVFEENENILGHCMIEECESVDDPIYYDVKTLFINSMCVDENAKGRQIGRALVDRVKAYAKEVVATRLSLLVYDFNKDAIKFYERLGLTARSTFMEMNIE